MKKEEEDIAKEEAANPHLTPRMMHLEVHNEALAGKNVASGQRLHGGVTLFVHVYCRTVMSVFLIVILSSILVISCLWFVQRTMRKPLLLLSVLKLKWIGKSRILRWYPAVFLITQPKMNGKQLGEFHFSSMYGVNVTRVNRSGMDIFASRNLTLRVGDRVMVVGPQDAVERVANLMGNSLKRLDHPNIVTIFVGIFLGIFFGSLPIAFPGIPTPVKLGLAGGPLIVSILIGRFGYKLKLVTYTTMSANLMLREIGIALFLASVGIKAGANFVNTVVDGDGLLYVGCGFLITVIPLLIMGAVARWHYKMNYFMLMGLIAGSNTDPPALAYSNQTAGNNAPAVGYSTVYPVSMFLRILTAQLLILILAS